MAYTTMQAFCARVSMICACIGVALLIAGFAVAPRVNVGTYQDQLTHYFFSNSPLWRNRTVSRLSSMRAGLVRCEPINVRLMHEKENADQTVRGSAQSSRTLCEVGGGLHAGMLVEYRTLGRTALSTSTSDPPPTQRTKHAPLWEAACGRTSAFGLLKFII